MQVYYNGFRKLVACQRAHQLTLEIYKVTRSFPSDEKFGVTSQLRRASSSVGAQIAEGSRMRTLVHRKSYYDRAYASTAEVDNFLELVKDLSYIDQKIYVSLLEKVNKLAFLVYQLSESCSVSRVTST